MKKWYQSRTIWLNVASVAATLVSALSQVLPSLQGLLDIQTYIIVNAGVAFLNIVLRAYFTSTAIG